MTDYDHKCTACERHEGAKTVCMKPRGGVNPQIVFIGDAPTVEEDKLGRPFVGPAGRILSAAIKDAGIKNFAITNTVRCAFSKSPLVKHVKACRHFLDDELAEWKPQIVVPMGNVALKTITGETGITKWSGVRMEDPRFIVFPMIHPASLLRPGSDSRIVKFSADMNALAALAEGKGARPTYDFLDEDEALDWLEAVAAYDGADWYTIDYETTDLNPWFGEIVTVAIHCAGDTVWMRWSDRIISGLWRLFNSGKRMVPHNATFELKWGLHHVVRKCVATEQELRRWRCPIGDTLLYHHLLDENGAHDLSHLSRIHTPIGGYDDEVIALKLSGTQHKDIPIQKLGNYNAGDAHATAYLFKEFHPQIRKGFATVWDNILEDAVWAITHAEYFGRKIDLDKADALNESLMETEADAYDKLMTDPRVQAWELKWHEGKHEDVKKPLPERRNKKTGVLEREAERFNPGSGDQLASLLFNEVGVPMRGKTDGGKPSVKEANLSPFRGRFPIVDTYLTWKEARTLRNNYLGTQRTKENPDGSGVLRYVRRNSFLYGSYLLHGTATGRLSSSQPNLQNFTERLRTIAVSRWPDGVFLEADFSQLELRLIAWQSGCEVLLEAYRHGADIHKLTAKNVMEMGYGKLRELDEITPEERQDLGKRVNFGLVYGMYPKRIANEWDIPLKDAKIIYDAYHHAYPELGMFTRSEQRRAQKHGYLTSFFGRRRRLPEAQVNVEDWQDPRKKAQIHALLSASNFSTQSLASDLNTWSFVQVTRTLANRGMKTLGIGLTHDSGAYDVPRDEVLTVAALVEDTMVRGVATCFPEIDVPMVADVKVGPSWGELAPLDEWRAA